MSNVIGTSNGGVFAPGLKRRGKAQNRRFNRGVQSGRLTEAEQASLKEMRKENRAALSEAKASGGSVNRQERIAMHADLSETRKTLAQYLRNGDVA